MLSQSLLSLTQRNVPVIAQLCWYMRVEFVPISSTWPAFLVCFSQRSIYHFCAKILSGLSNFHSLLLQPWESYRGSLDLVQVLKSRLDEGGKNNSIAWCGLAWRLHWHLCKTIRLLRSSKASRKLLRSSQYVLTLALLMSKIYSQGSFRTMNLFLLKTDKSISNAW